MSRNRPLIAGNWKMYKTSAEAVQMVQRLIPLVSRSTGVDIAVAPPFTWLQAVGQAVLGTNIDLAAQNLHWEKEGAFTGEISARMLKSAGCKYVVVGHSERRQLFGETNDSVAKKLESALESDLVPILCVGETLAQREVNLQEKVVRKQLEESLALLSTEQIARLVVAYEPVWAIGTGQTATPEIAQSMHRCIRDWLVARLGPTLGGKVCILYGGSVKPDNITALMAQPDIDGALVGAASLDAESFAKIVNY